MLGRAVFAKICQQCHTLFGIGGKIGPELTGSNRADLDYLLSNILDPSAVMAKEYQPSVIVTTDGRVITGLIREQTPTALTVQTANELVVLPKGEIDELKLSDQSMMPDDLLKPLSDARSPCAGGLPGLAVAGADPGHGRQPEEFLQRHRPGRLAGQRVAVGGRERRDRRPHARA